MIAATEKLRENVHRERFTISREMDLSVFLSKEEALRVLSVLGHSLPRDGDDSLYKQERITQASGGRIVVKSQEAKYFVTHPDLMRTRLDYFINVFPSPPSAPAVPVQPTRAAVSALTATPQVKKPALTYIGEVIHHDYDISADYSPPSESPPAPERNGQLLTDDKPKNDRAPRIPAKRKTKKQAKPQTPSQVLRSFQKNAEKHEEVAESLNEHATAIAAAEFFRREIRSVLSAVRAKNDIDWESRKRRTWTAVRSLLHGADIRRKHTEEIDLYVDSQLAVIQLLAACKTLIDGMLRGHSRMTKEQEHAARLQLEDAIIAAAKSFNPEKGDFHQRLERLLKPLAGK